MSHFHSARGWPQYGDTGGPQRLFRLRNASLRQTTIDQHVNEDYAEPFVEGGLLGCPQRACFADGQGSWKQERISEDGLIFNSDPRGPNAEKIS